jgi:hypothetical protein
MEPGLANPYFAKVYDLYVILGAPDSPQLWEWENWQKLAARIDPLVALSRNKAAVRTTQFVVDQKRTVSFGQIGWNEKGHHKWTHNSPTTNKTSLGWSFLGMEMWSPTWSICEREKEAPDIYFAFLNENFWPKSNSLKFNQTIIFAIGQRLGTVALDNARKFVLQLSSDLNSPLFAYQKRTWGKAFGNSGGFSDCIQNLASIGLFKVGNYHNRPLDLNTFAEKWELLGSSQEPVQGLAR